MNFLIEKLETELDSFDIFQRVASEPFVFFLDSSLKSGANGRYSFIGYDPFEVVQAQGPQALDILQKQFSSYSYRSDQHPFPLMTGAVGYMSYDYGLHQERIKAVSKKDIHIPDCMFGFYDRIIVVDHLSSETYIVSTGWPEKEEALQKKRAQVRLDEAKQKIYSRTNSDQLNTSAGDLTLRCNFTKEQYIQAAQKALNYIADGDVYQINLSQRFEALTENPLSAVEIYKMLRALSPTNFSSYFDCGDFKIIGRSPERFLSLKNNVVQTQPMKGTRPRGLDAA